MSTFESGCCVITLRDVIRSPAMCCVIEFEDVIVRHFGGELRSIDAAKADCGHPIAFIVVLNFAQMRKIGPLLSYLRKKGTVVVVYVFDGWLAHGKLSLFRKMQSKFDPSYLISKNFDLLCVPFKRTVEDLRHSLDAEIMHVPLAVDTSLSDGARRDRPLTFLAYGRQPKELIERISLMFNVKGSAHFMYHTNHMKISSINDFYAHRRMFWSVLERSVFAFSFMSFDEERSQSSRFPFPFVGQRWFEAMAAGCVVVGQRPTGEEADQLLDWPDSTLELDRDPDAAIDQLFDWLGDPDRLASIGLRNAAKTREKHDWTARLDLIEPKVQEILGRRGGSAPIRGTGGGSNFAAARTSS
jgi:Glycosyl transferases group 1